MISGAYRRYQDLFQVKGIRESVAPALLGKLQPGMYSLSLLMLLSHRLSYSAAALVTSGAAWGAMTAPVRGRLLDRFPYARVLWPLLFLHLGFLALLFWGLQQHFSLLVLFLAALSASVVLPPINTITRVIWRARATSTVLPTALALDAVLTDVGFVVGPVLAIGLGRIIAPAAGLLVCAALMAVSVPLVLRNIRESAPARRSSPGHWAGPLRRAKAWWVLLVASCFFFGVALMETVLAAQGSGAEVTLTGGAVLTIVAVASVVGGLTAGGLPAPVTARLTQPHLIVTVIASAMLLMAGLSALADWSVYLAGVPVGFCLGPCFMAIYGAAGRTAGPDEQAEAQSWVAGAFSAGGALGTAVGGWTVQHHGHALALTTGGLVMALGGLAGLPLRNRLQRSPASHRPDSEHYYPDAPTGEGNGMPAPSVPKQ